MDKFLNSLYPDIPEPDRKQLLWITEDILESIDTVPDTLETIEDIEETYKTFGLDAALEIWINFNHNKKETEKRKMFDIFNGYSKSGKKVTVYHINRRIYIEYMSSGYNRKFNDDYYTENDDFSGIVLWLLNNGYRR